MLPQVRWKSSNTCMCVTHVHLYFLQVGGIDMLVHHILCVGFWGGGLLDKVYWFPLFLSNSFRAHSLIFFIVHRNPVLGEHTCAHTHTDTDIFIHTWVCALAGTLTLEGHHNKELTCQKVTREKKSQQCGTAYHFLFMIEELPTPFLNLRFQVFFVCMW